MERADIGVVGMAVMGRNLARNITRHGYSVALHNRTSSRTEEVMAEYGSEGTFIPAFTPTEFARSLSRPRRIILMVKAGAPVDAAIDSLLPLLEEGDILVDGGNSRYTDTRSRQSRLDDHGVHFVGTGISGGEEGALHGPSIMPGGSPAAYAAIGPILEEISASYEGEPCCAHMGPDGAGHYVKMVHNGIEYADMQFIAEAYDLLRATGMGTDSIADVFLEWNTGPLESYLIEITSTVLRQRDPRTGSALVDVIKDTAGQKGTGMWTVQSGLDLGVPINTIAESVFARGVSSAADLRSAGQHHLTGPDQHIDAAPGFVHQVHDALWAAKVVAYAQGLDQIREASLAYEWGIDLAQVAKIWRAGCIIQARLLEQVRSEYAAADLPSLLAARSIREGLTRAQEGWRSVVGQAASSGVPVPGFSAALAYYDSVRAHRLPAALLQGLRDYFGAHTYERIDDAGRFHVDWSGDGAETRQA